MAKMFYRKKMLEKAAAIKRFEYLPLGKELNAQADMAKKQYQKLDDTYELDKVIKKEKPTLQNYSKSDPTYDISYSFFKYYRDTKNSDNLSLKSKYSFLVKPFSDLNQQRESTNKTKNKKTNVYDKASDLCNYLLEIYFNETMNYQMLK